MKIKFVLIALVSVLFFSCSKPGDAIIQRAMRSYQSQDFEGALTYFLQALEEDTSYSDEIIYSFISNLYAAQDDLKNAVLYLEKSLELKPDYRSYVTAGMYWHLLKNDENAEKDYFAAIEMNPDKGEAYASLGQMQLKQKKIDDSIKNLEKACLLEPRIAVIPANLGVAYAMKGDFEKADEYLKKAEELKCANLDEFLDLVEDMKNESSQ